MGDFSAGSWRDFAVVCVWVGCLGFDEEIIIARRIFKGMCFCSVMARKKSVSVIDPKQNISNALRLRNVLGGNEWFSKKWHWAVLVFFVCAVAILLSLLSYFFLDGFSRDLYVNFLALQIVATILIILLIVYVFYIALSRWNQKRKLSMGEKKEVKSVVKKIES